MLGHDDRTGTFLLVSTQLFPVPSLRRAAAAVSGNLQVDVRASDSNVAQVRLSAPSPAPAAADMVRLFKQALTETLLHEYRSSESPPTPLSGPVRTLTLSAPGHRTSCQVRRDGDRVLLLLTVRRDQIAWTDLLASLSRLEGAVITLETLNPLDRYVVAVELPHGDLLNTAVPRLLAELLSDPSTERAPRLLQNEGRVRHRQRPGYHAPRPDR